MLKSLVWRLCSQSDLTHCSLALASSSLLLPTLSPSSLALLHLTSLTTGLGTQLYVSLVSGPTMFLNLPRNTFGDIQARLFPKMGAVCMSSSLLCLGTYSASHTMDTATLLLTTSLLVNILNSFLLFPKVTKLMLELRKHDEGTEERKAAGKRFGITHGVSNLINLVSLG